MREHAHLQHFELLLDSSFICVHEAGQFRQADGGVQLEELLQHRQLALLVHKGHEAPELLPVCLLSKKAAHSQEFGSNQQFLCTDSNKNNV